MPDSRAEASTSLPAPRRIALPPLRLPDGRSEPGITLSVHEAGSGPAVVMSHGFPELGYSWRHQFAPLVRAGFRAIAPDQRGYGASDRPEPIEAYDIHRLCGDLVGLLDALRIEKAVFVGHDWGGFVVWAMPYLHPGRVAGVVGVNTPLTPRTPVPPTQLMRAMVGGDDERMYILWFQKPGVAEAVLDQNPGLLFEKILRSGVPMEELAARVGPQLSRSEPKASGESPGVDMNPFRRLAELEPFGAPIGDDAERAHYTRVFCETGFRGGINWYRNLDRNWETAPEIGAKPIDVPCLMVCAAWDPVLRPEMAAAMPMLCRDLETVTIDRCGHWTQQERPDELNRILVDWLRRRIA